MTDRTAFFSKTKKDLKDLSIELEISLEQLKYYFSSQKFPLGKDLDKICRHFKINTLQAKVIWGIVDDEVLKHLYDNIESLDNVKNDSIITEEKLNKVFSSELGELYQNDCLDYLNTVEDNSFDLVFADPPFNLNKSYPSNMNDNLGDQEYIKWMFLWINEAVRTLKPGGSLFLWNLPKWNIEVVQYLQKVLDFKHWIAVDMKYSLPIPGKLYPSHYSLLYFTKGKKAKTFKPDRIPMQICPKCYGDLKDYGGYKNKMNPNGISLTDVWYDIPPVRHSKYKRRKDSNELSIKLLDRIIELSTEPGDLIYDPFGGSGSTYVTAELKGRRWVGTEIGPAKEIIERFNILNDEKDILNDYRDKLNKLFIDKNKSERIKRGIWTNESFDKNNK